MWKSHLSLLSHNTTESKYVICLWLCFECNLTFRHCHQWCLQLPRLSTTKQSSTAHVDPDRCQLNVSSLHLWESAWPCQGTSYTMTRGRAADNYQPDYDSLKVLSICEMNKQVVEMECKCRYLCQYKSCYFNYPL